MIDIKRYKQSQMIYKLKNKLYYWRLSPLTRWFVTLPNSFGFYVGKKIKSYDEINKIIYESIMAGKPFMVSRFGSNELDNLKSYFDKLAGMSSDGEEKFERLCTFAGFFPREYSMRDKFADVLYEAAKMVDVLGVWNLPCEPFMIGGCRKA